MLVLFSDKVKKKGEKRRKMIRIFEVGGLAEKFL